MTIKWRHDVDQALTDAQTRKRPLLLDFSSRYKATNDPKALGETAAAFDTRYADSSWAKKASVWKR